MAYMSQERKKSLEPKIKEILKKYGIKATLGVRHHSTLQLKIKSGTINFFEDEARAIEESNVGRPSYAPTPDQIRAQTYSQVNPYWLHEHYVGKAKDFLMEVRDAMNIGNHDNSDIQSDYFDVGWYVDIDIGQWDKPYELIKEKENV
jgi:hypothetical protein